MLSPVRATASWLGGRLLLLLVIIAALVASDAYRDEFSLLTARLKALLPDAELVERLEAGRKEMGVVARERTDRVIRDLQTAPAQSAAGIDARIAELGVEIAGKEKRRRSSLQKMISLLNGNGFQEDISNEIDIQLLTAERDALQRLKNQLGGRQLSLQDAARQFVRARDLTLSTWAAYRATKKELQDYEDANALLVWVPGSAPWKHATAVRGDARRLASESANAGKDRSSNRRSAFIATDRLFGAPACERNSRPRRRTLRASQPSSTRPSLRGTPREPGPRAPPGTRRTTS